MSIPSTHRDLLESPIPVALATISPAGHPQVTAVWAVLDGDQVVISMTEARQKLKNLRACPQATAFVIDPGNPYRTLEVRGHVTIMPDDGLAVLRKVVTAYGADLTSFSGPLDDRVAVTLHPTHVVAIG